MNLGKLAIAAPLLILGAKLVSLGEAAEDAVCKPYATALLEAQMQWLWNRAYSHCSLLEEVHPVPPEKGDWTGALKILVPGYTPLASLGVAPATEAPPKSAPPAPAAVPAAVVTSGAAAATSWQVKCARTHPAGYNAGKGTYNALINKKWTPVPCPR